MKNREIRERLLALQDTEYRAFQCKLTPTLSPEDCIGVRTPEVRRLAKELYRQGGYEAFLQDLPHRYYDENNLHGFLIAQMSSYEQCLEEVDRFLPYVDNWATCDLLSPKIFAKNKDRLIGEIRRWMSSDRVYTIRFGMEMLMSLYLDEAFDPRYLEWVAAIRSEEYYVNMMIAWFFATALAKQYDAAVKYLQKRSLAEWVHRKTIQKACESYRIADGKKAYLRSLK